MLPITLLILSTLAVENIEDARPLLTKLLMQHHGTIKAHRYADALLSAIQVPGNVESELPALLGLPAEIVSEAFRTTRDIQIKNRMVLSNSEMFTRYGPHIHIEMGRPTGSLITAGAFTERRIGKLPEDIHTLPEALQNELVRQAIDAMMNEHGEIFRSVFSSLNGFSYRPTADVYFWLDINGNIEKCFKFSGTGDEMVNNNV